MYLTLIITWVCQFYATTSAIVWLYLTGDPFEAANLPSACLTGIPTLYLSVEILSFVSTSRTSPSMKELATIIAVIHDIRFGMLALLVSVVGGFQYVLLGWQRHEERLPFLTESAPCEGGPSYGSSGTVDYGTLFSARKRYLKSRIRLSKNANPRNFINLVSGPYHLRKKSARD